MIDAMPRYRNPRTPLSIPIGVIARAPSISQRLTHQASQILYLYTHDHTGQTMAINKLYFFIFKKVMSG